MSDRVSLLTKVLKSLHSDIADVSHPVKKAIEAFMNGKGADVKYSRSIPVDTVLDVLAGIEEGAVPYLLLLQQIKQTDFRGIELRLQAARVVQLQSLYDDYVDENIIQLYERVAQEEEEEGEFDDDFDDPMVNPITFFHIHFFLMVFRLRASPLCGMR